MGKYLPYVFTKQEIVGNHKNVKQAENWLASRLKSNQIKKVRNGLYVLIDQAGCVYSSKFEIACKISKTSFISYHSALEFYGFANQVTNNVIVSGSNRFNDFEFEDIDYVSKQTNNFVGVEHDITSGVRITCLERTVVDCINNINLAGGIEELLYALEQIKILDENVLLHVLESYNKVVLYQKVGFVLEQFNDGLKLSESFFDECRNHLTNQVKYFLENDYSEIIFQSKWLLMAPKNLKARLYGGII